MIFSIYIAKAFFPSGDELSSLLATLATYGVGFVLRPVGAIVLGQYADRQGRRAALTLIILLMLLGSAMIAFAPTYAQIGASGAGADRRGAAGAGVLDWRRDGRRDCLPDRDCAAAPSRVLCQLAICRAGRRIAGCWEPVRLRAYPSADA